MVKRYLVAFAMSALAGGWAYGCSSSDSNNNPGPTDAKADTKAKDVVDIPPEDTGPTCTAGDVSGFTPTATKGVEAAHQGKCSSDQVSALVKCMQDFQANANDCKTAGLDFTKTLSTMAINDCGKCLLILPGKPQGVLEVRAVGDKLSLGYNDVACLDSFAGAECAKQDNGYADCLDYACGQDQGCTTSDQVRNCWKTASKKCASYAEAAVACVDPANTPDGADGGKVFISDAGTTTNPAVDICGQFPAFTGNDMPDDIAWAWTNYLCGSK